MEIRKVLKKRLSGAWIGRDGERRKEGRTTREGVKEKKEEGRERRSKKESR